MRQNIILGISSAVIIGLGQILKGETEKGLKFLLTFYFGISILLYVTLGLSGGLFLIVFGITVIFALLFWIYNIWDALQ